MTGMWVIFLLNGMVPELATIPTETMFSIAADNATALLLVAAGYGLYAGKRWAERAFMISMCALFYSLMIAIGYYAQLGGIRIPRHICTHLHPDGVLHTCYGEGIG
ncbi:MAG TPA: hypothetical protein VMW22_05935 [Candidatus Desulfaltia sp.]|nr:hypothetical protein [Candidatus Desulfaltia sp.]